ncbi:MAG: tRNA 2-selenouridine(34) synthase MnmH [Bacteroidetes bacterium]|nr:tRNA 2-selenouridine(34) synthase MnmH [Bacteroidota bacterium]
MQLLCSVPDFLVKRQSMPVFDVRTPAEFANGHIPGAINLPLFSDQERHEIGLIYAQEGKKPAILKGLDFVGPKMRMLVDQVLAVTNSRVVGVYCWRGGMRSDAVAWLLGFYGFTAWRVEGGYKSIRRTLLAEMMQPRPVRIIGGRTGSGKTQVLHELQGLGEPVIDLEELAHHKGSAFGDIDEPPQPTQEQFDNLLGLSWLSHPQESRLWLEDESHFTGSIQINEHIWKVMRQAPVVYLDVPEELRADNLVDSYGRTDRENLKRSILKIREKLGGADTKLALDLLEKDRYHDLAILLLRRYYDPGYDYGLARRSPETIHRVVVTDRDFRKIALKLKDLTLS